MTMQLFSKMTGIDYQDVQLAVKNSEIHVPGKNIEYSSSELQRVVTEHLQRRERRIEHELATVRKDICKAHNLMEAWA